MYPFPSHVGISSLSSLADELSVSVSAGQYAFSKAQTQRVCVRLQILSSGSLFRRYRPKKSGTYQEIE